MAMWLAGRKAGSGARPLLNSLATSPAAPGVAFVGASGDEQGRIAEQPDRRRVTQVAAPEAEVLEGTFVHLAEQPIVALRANPAADSSQAPARGRRHRREGG